jgi:hypothetical protein
VEGVLVSRGGDDGVHFSAERESDCGLDRVAGDPACADDALTILVGVSTSETPDSNCYASLGRYVRNLFFGTDEGDVGFERLGQRLARDLRTDTTWIA